MSKRKKKRPSRARKASPNATIQSKCESLSASHNIVDQKEKKALMRQWFERLKVQYTAALEKKCRIINDNISSIDILLPEKPSNTEFPVLTWMQCIPCFDEGWINVTINKPGSILHRFYWRLNSIDYEKKTMELVVAHRQDQDIYDTYVECEVQFFPETGEFSPLLYDGTITFDKIIHCLNTVADCRWNMQDMAVWRSLQVADNPPDPTEDAMGIIHDFLGAIIYANCLMTSKKPTSTKHAGKQLSADTARCLEPSVANGSIISYDTTLIVHTNGPVPGPALHEQTESDKKTLTSVTYTMSSWLTRGHTRTSKNGVTYRVGPYISHRHGMEDIDVSVNKHITIKQEE